MVTECFNTKILLTVNLREETPILMSFSVVLVLILSHTKIMHFSNH